MIDEEIDRLHSEIASAAPADAEAVEALRVSLLGRKGKITALFDEFKALPPEEKRRLGQKINELKEFATSTVKSWQENCQQVRGSKQNAIDITRSAEPIPSGTLHPLSLVQQEIEGIFAQIGFEVAQGPELEDDWHVFTALNFPPNHPARDMQDTFFIQHAPDVLLRTHTSSVQVRVMEKTQPPIRVICPGRVFRNEDISARAHCQFHQIEGLYVAEKVTFADLKQVLLYFAQRMFGPETAIRLRPSFFPFTEPSAEVDVSCNLCHGQGCNVCKHSGWLEILGCGMVDPNVLEACHIDPTKYSGYAFGMGVERIAMLKFQIPDIRLFFEDDLRFLGQFKL